MLPRLLFSTLTLVCLCFCLFASDEEDKAKAKAALELAKAKRERETKAKVNNSEKPKATIHEGDWYTDLDLAKRVSVMLKKPLVIWVSLSPLDKDVSDIYRILGDDVVNVVTRSYNDDVTSRIIVPDRNGDQFRLLKNDINTASPIGLRKRMGLEVTQDMYDQFKEAFYRKNGYYYTGITQNPVPTRITQPVIQNLAPVSQPAFTFPSGGFAGSGVGTVCNT